MRCSMGLLICLLLASVRGYTRSVVRPASGAPSLLPLSHRVRTSALCGGLDLSDVLDPENEEMNAFIKQLKSQMSNSLHASPREVTNRIKAFFSSKSRVPLDSSEMETFRAYLQANKEVLDVVNAVLLFEGSVRGGMHITELLPWEDLLHAMEHPSPTLTSSVIYRGISCLKATPTDRDEKFTRQYLGLLMRRVEESGVLLNEVDLCPAIYCCAQFSVVSGPMRQFVKYCARSLAATEANFPSKSLCSALFGLRKMKVVPEVKNLLAEIANKIKASETLYHPINVCIAINGLQNMDDSTPEVRDLLSALVQKSILADEQGIDKVTDREISMALMGIKEMGGAASAESSGFSLREGHRSDASKELRETLKYITSLMRFYDGEFEAKRLSFAVLGLAGLSSRTLEVKDLIGVLAAKAAACTGSMTGQEVSMSLRGLMGMDSDDANVKALVRGLLPLVKGCRSWDSSDMQSALIGLQGMRYSSVEANKLVEAVAELTDRSVPQVLFRTAEQASMSLYCIQGMGSVTPEARRLLAQFPRLMSSLRREFTGRDVSQALYGLRSTRCNHKETLSVLQTLQPFLDNTQGYVSSQNIASAMCGLQNMESSTPEVQRLCRSLITLTGRCTGTLSGKGVSKCLNGLQRLRSKDAVVVELCDSLAVMLERSEQGFDGFDDFFQISSACSAFTNKFPEDRAVVRLGNALARLLTHHKKDGSALRQTPSAERVAVAIYALQEVARGPTPAFVNTIMSELLEYMRAMPSPQMKSLGMMMQGFKGVVTPSEPFVQALEILGDKIECGWSARLSRGKQGSRKQFQSETSGEEWREAQTTLRSCLTGLAAMNKQVPARRRIINLLMEDLKGWPLDRLEKRTLEAISATFYYKGRFLAEQASAPTTALLAEMAAAFEEHGLGSHYKRYAREARGGGEGVPVKNWSKAPVLAGERAVEAAVTVPDHQAAVASSSTAAAVAPRYSMVSRPAVAQ